MKNLFFSILFIAITQLSFSQENYCDFEGLQSIIFGPATGIMDTAEANPAPNGVNSSANCAKYVRSISLYDNFKLYPSRNLADITPYAANLFSTPKITMKVFTTAPAGTVIDLQLGSKSDDNYPSGIHSEYRAVTSVQNAWQTVTFNYLQTTTGGTVAPTDIDKVVILLSPNSTNVEIMYFDDPAGPELLPVAVSENLAGDKLFQNSPNPSTETTHINFQLNTGGAVSLKLYDWHGNAVLSILDKNMRTGNYSIPLETRNLPGGVYFYVLNKEGVTQTKKLIVSK